MQGFTDTTKHICVIGAGAAGLAALKIIVQTPQYKANLWKPTAFESRENIGGVWLPALPTDDPPLTPLYDSLTTNVPHPVMASPDFPFPPSTPLFPRASVVQDYYQSYASHFGLLQHIELNTSVQDVRWDKSSSKWKVRISDNRVLDFDLVLVASGHFRVPRYPKTSGLTQWITTGRAQHSAWYRRPNSTGCKVLVVGGGPSGQDICAETRVVPGTAVVHSVTGAQVRDFENVKFRGAIAHYGDDGQVVFEDGSTESGIDHCILATGYETAFPFLSDAVLTRGIPPSVLPLPDELYDSSYHIFPLARQMFPFQKTAAYPPSSLAFLGLPIRGIPFPLVEAQTRAVLRVFAQPDALDAEAETADIMHRYDTLVRELGAEDEIAIAKAWRRFQGDEMWDYRDSVHVLADAGPEVLHWRVPEWVKAMYAKKELLRAGWKDLERCGEAEEFLRGVGEAGGAQGESEWVNIMQKVLQRAEEKAISMS